VWPVFKDMRSWYPEYTFEVLAGPPYETGSGLMEHQVIKVTSSHTFPTVPNSEDAGRPDYFVTKIIKVTPPEKIVAVLSGSAYDWKQYCSFYVWTLTGTETRTTILVESYAEAELAKPLSKDEYAQYHDELTKNWHRSWSTAFANLRHVMDADT
jgi:hypothetical protein